MRSCIVAIVDDDITHYLRLKAFFFRLPVVVTTLHFPNGQEAYDFLMKNASNETSLPDYIFLDVNMPKMGGWELLDKLEKIQDDLPKKIYLYLISGSKEEGDRADKHTLLKGFLHKPISESSIREIFNEVLYTRK